ncbi:MAG: homoserine kinase [Verrucomicrobiota bacterium]
MSQNSVIVQAPASTSNCGPGFDTLSIALSLYNFVKLTQREDDRIHCVGESIAGTDQMVDDAAKAFAVRSGLSVGGFDYEIWGEVPRARGLGSSSTVRAGIIAGLNRLHGEPLDREAMIQLTTRLDNAPDNACAVFAGGFCVARTAPETFAYLEHIRFELPDSLIFIAVSPDYEVLTANSRRVLPDSIPFDDVVRSANSLAYLVAAFVSGKFERLHGAIHDFIHEPYRGTLNPFARESIAAGRHSGAYTGWLSGSGSTVICLTEKSKALAVGDAMQSAYKSHGVESRVYRLGVENTGLVIN